MASPAAAHRNAVLAKLADDAKRPRSAPKADTDIPTPPMGIVLEAGDDIDGDDRGSPASMHRRSVLARQAADTVAVGSAAARPTEGPEATEYELLLAELGGDITRLKDIQSVEAKIALKVELVEKYDVHVDATLAAAAETGKALQDEIVTRMMLWRIDIGDFERGLDLAEHVLTFGLTMPSNISRKPAVLIAEEVAEAALKADSASRDFPMSVIDRTMTVTEKHDMPDQVRAKLFKARGRLCLRAATAMEANPATAPAGGPRAGRLAALAAFRRAVELDKGCGVKKDIERLAPLERDAGAVSGTQGACAPAPGGGEGTGDGQTA